MLTVQGIVWCVWMVAAGVPLALLGLALDAQPLLLGGGALMLAVACAWPVLLLAGALDEMRRQQRPHRR